MICSDEVLFTQTKTVEIATKYHLLKQFFKSGISDKRYLKLSAWLTYC